MDPTTTELLSRLLDGDLDAAEAERLERRLAAEPELAAELEALRRLQGQVRAVAERMAPPSDLDSILLPLQRGATPPPPRIHPAVRWIGMAAGLALAVTVAVEVARHPTEPPPAAARPVATPAPPPRPSDFFQLKPLPTSPAPPGEEPLGAADRLLASPPAEAPLPEPEPLDVRGPLAEEEIAGRSDDTHDLGKTSNEVGKSPSRATSETVTDKRQRSAPDQAGAGPTAGSAVAAPQARRLEDEAEATVSSLADGDKKETQVSSATLVLIGADGESVAELAVEGLPAERAEVVVTVQGELIVALEGPVGDITRRSTIGRVVPGVADGRYRGTFEPSKP